jgi:GNAT superfamily N-acetyltransferase
MLKLCVAPSGFSSPNSGRRDMDPHRQQLFIDAITAAEKHYLGPEWGNKRLELADCAADPKYHRRGAGKALLEYGLEKAGEANVPITLTASPMGRHLYLHLGFQELGFFDCGEEGQEEKVRTWVMVWTPEGWKKEAPV